MKPTLERFSEACNFPGSIDEIEVGRSLARYLDALGVKRRVIKLCRPWSK